MAHRKRHKVHTKTKPGSTADTIVFMIMCLTGLVALLCHFIGIPLSAVPWVVGVVLLLIAAAWLARRVKLSGQAEFAAQRVAHGQAPVSIMPIGIAHGDEYAINIKGELAFRYHPKVGAETDRIVTVKTAGGFVTEGGSFVADRLHAYCHKARAPRIFLLTHILSAYDPGTGEVVPSIHEWVRHHATQ